MKVSLLLLTHDRYQLTKYCLNNLLSKIGDIDYELLILDNDSKDFRTIELGMNTKKASHIASTTNIGIAAGFNKLISIAKGEYICFLSNDIFLLNENWLFDLINYNNEIDKSGLTSIHCEGDKGFYSPLLNNSDTFTNVWKRQDNITSGISLINRTALEAVGLFDESLGLYGREREQYAQRLNLLGYNNYYIPEQFSIHLGREINDNSEYKQMKDKALQLGNARYNAALAEMKTKKSFKL